ncbi:hypothetical protein T12_2798, partial [Trichinella patagoniensis]
MLELTTWVAVVIIVEELSSSEFYLVSSLSSMVLLCLWFVSWYPAWWLGLPPVHWWMGWILKSVSWCEWLFRVLWYGGIGGAFFCRCGGWWSFVIYGFLYRRGRLMEQEMCDFMEKDEVVTLLLNALIELNILLGTNKSLATVDPLPG